MANRRGNTLLSTFNYAYDGNIVTKLELKGTTSYTYDTFRRLVSVQNDNFIAVYAYNPDGLRISKDVTAGGETTATRFLYDGGLITLELDGDGNQAAHNVYGNGSVISRSAQHGTVYYLYNGRGDVVQLINASGNVMTTYDYDAFGNQTMGSPNDTNPFRYCGEYFDIETETYYLRARYYSPSTGRFTQRDPFLGFQADPLSLNRYTYAHNNPIKYADPTGYAAVWVTMPDGSRAAATITNGVTTMANGGRPPVGAIVHAANGRDYQMQASGRGVEVPRGSAPATVSTPTGTQAATISNGVTTMTSTGQRPQNGWIVHTPSGASYQMDASLGHGLQTTAVPVIAPDGGISVAGLRGGVTTMADGTRPQHGSMVLLPSGTAYRMDATLGRGVRIADGLPEAVVKRTSDIANTASFGPQPALETAPLTAVLSASTMIAPLPASTIASLSAALPWLAGSVSAALASAKAAVATSLVPALRVATIILAGAAIAYVVDQATTYVADANRAKAWVDAHIAEGGIKGQLRGNLVYVIYANDTNRVWCVGITNDFARRRNEHQGGSQPAYPDSAYTMIPVANFLTRAESRALEQALITAYTIEALNNKINAIARGRWREFETEFARVNSLIFEVK